MTTASTRECPDIAAVEALAARLGTCLRSGDAILLEGPIGVGKTRFVQAVVAALGSQDIVTSPTYTLMHVYRTPAAGTVLHLDACRLSGAAEYRDLGIEDLMDDAITMVEWGDRVACVHPGHLRIELAHAGSSGSERRLTFASRSERWQAFCAAMAAAA